jgi:uncharacterized membrane protein
LVLLMAVSFLPFPTRAMAEAIHSGLRWAADAISPSLGFYALVIVLAAFAPRVAVFGFLALAIRAIVGTR